MHVKDVLARKNEKLRLKQIKKMTKRDIFISIEIMTLIPDSKIEWKNSNDIWNAEQAKKLINQRDDDFEFIVNTTDDSNLEIMTTDDENEL